MNGPHVRFVSGNPHKIKETQEILSPFGVTVTAVNLKIHELQTEDPELLVRHKVLEAFERIGWSVVVEHTGLYLESLNGLSGGLTQIFWDKLQADRFCELFGKTENRRLEAKTTIAYLDGKKVYFFEGAIKGTIAEQPAGDRAFQWDCIFKSDGYDKTFAELGAVKNSISMRKRVLEQLATFLKKP